MAIAMTAAQAFSQPLFLVLQLGSSLSQSFEVRAASHASGSLASRAQWPSSRDPLPCCPPGARNELTAPPP